MNHPIYPQDTKLVILTCDDAVLVRWNHKKSFEFVVGWSPVFDENGKLDYWCQGHYFGHDFESAVIKFAEYLPKEVK